MANGFISAEKGTRYPLVLVPGMLGFIRLPRMPYWYGIVAALQRQGTVAIPVMVSSLHSTEVRGEQLLLRIESVLASTGASRVNLLGHSHGALTARYAAALRPDLVASVTSLAGPNHGSELADYLATRYPPDSLRGRLLGATTRGLARLVAWLDCGYRGPRLPLDSHASQQSLTSAGVARFNQQYPQGLPETWGGQGEALVNGVRYYSWSGVMPPRASRNGGGQHWGCRLFARTFVKEKDNSDGMVGRFSSHLGLVIADDYPLDHLDIVNQGFGPVGPGGVDPVLLFIEHAERLAAAGL